ncbi:MAG: phosphodiesterase [Christensenellales bacterium]|nr:phosphodiesterase [Christensenellales bacterium]
MKLMFASDLHGSLSAAQAIFNRYQAEGADRLVLLGDLLYHGPRNDLPDAYDPKGVTALLNAHKDDLLCVRGNCDAEVDQMVLNFPIQADYALFDLDGTTAFVTHGHLFNTAALPPHKTGDLLIHGHTHVLTVQQADGMTYINPGSAALPKEGNPKSYMVYENGVFSIKTLEGEVIRTHSIR